MNAPLLHLVPNDTRASKQDAHGESHPHAAATTSADDSRSELSLPDLRAAIETVDETIIRMIAERMALSRAVGRVKAASGQPIMDPAREAAVVARASVLARDVGLPEDEIRALYWRLIACSRRAQMNA